MPTRGWIHDSPSPSKLATGPIEFLGWHRKIPSPACKLNLAAMWLTTGITESTGTGSSPNFETLRHAFAGCSYPSPRRRESVNMLESHFQDIPERPGYL